MMAKWIRENRPATCDWWQTTEYPDQPVWHTECGRCGHDEHDQGLANTVMRSLSADSCPWCGGLLSEVDLADIEAEWRAENEYREGIARGTMGY